jgi:hypothetical protein
MPTTTIKSDIGEQVISSRPLRTFEVPDASESQFEAQSDIAPKYANAEPIGAFNARQLAQRGHSIEDLKRAEEAMKTARAAKMGGSRLSSAAKARIDMLCGISRAKREIVLDGQEYKLQILKAKEQKDAILEASRVDGIETPFAVRHQILARSLYHVGGVDMDLLVGDTSIEARLEALDELPETLLIKLFDEYNKLFEETRDRYFPKTEAEVAQVVEDLKK